MSERTQSFETQLYRPDTRDSAGRGGKETRAGKPVGRGPSRRSCRDEETGGGWLGWRKDVGGRVLLSSSPDKDARVDEGLLPTTEEIIQAPDKTLCSRRSSARGAGIGAERKKTFLAWQDGPCLLRLGPQFFFGL